MQKDRITKAPKDADYNEPLVRYRELGTILPQLAERGIHTQVVTSAVRPIPLEWAGLHRLQICVSIDGLPPEHDERRITPCQFGGDPDCANCGCMASAALEAVGRHKLGGGIPVGKIFYASMQVGRAVERLRAS